MKKLMIMGAGIYRVPLIKKAKEMGIYTIAVSIPGNYPGFAHADKVYYENTVDYEKILEIAREEADRRDRDSRNGCGRDHDRESLRRAGAVRYSALRRQKIASNKIRDEARNMRSTASAPHVSGKLSF